MKYNIIKQSAFSKCTRGSRRSVRTHQNTACITDGVKEKITI